MTGSVDYKPLAIWVGMDQASCAIEKVLFNKSEDQLESGFCSLKGSNKKVNECDGQAEGACDF